MTIIGWLGVVAGCLTILIGIIKLLAVHETYEQSLWIIALVGVPAALSGFIIVGFGAAVEYLAKIEGRLRKQGDGETALEASAVAADD